MLCPVRIFSDVQCRWGQMKPHFQLPFFANVALHFAVNLVHFSVVHIVPRKGTGSLSAQIAYNLAVVRLMLHLNVMLNGLFEEHFIAMRAFTLFVLRCEVSITLLFRSEPYCASLLFTSKR